MRGLDLGDIICRMQAVVLVHPDPEQINLAAQALLKDIGLQTPHPDLLILDEEKLGVEMAKKVRSYLSLKPYQSKVKAVVILQAFRLTPEAQSSLLKTLEEPPGECLIILGVASQEQLLPTILSRCQIQALERKKDPSYDLKYEIDIQKLLSLNTADRFSFIADLNDRDQFLQDLTKYFQPSVNLASHLASGSTKSAKEKLAFLKDLLQAQKWADSNINIRAILEYLMLKLPTNSH